MTALSALGRVGRFLPRRHGPQWPSLQEEAMSAIAAASEQVGVVLPVAAALCRAGGGSFSQEEETWIARIEQRRRATNSSKEVIKYQDYGAGTPDARRQAAEMARGVEVEEVVGKISRVCSKSPALAALLFSIVRQQKPESCVEMGTCVGISGAYIAAALHLNRRGRLVTLEGGAALAEVARRNFAALSLDGIVEIVVGPFHETLLDVLRAAAPVDFIFIDGHHDEQATKDYVAMALPFLSSQAVAVFDDINWSDGMKRAWSSITAGPRCAVQFSLRDLGIALLRGGSGEATGKG
jgi:predicted O-methyltransferase YrrM